MQESRISPTTALAAAACPGCGAPHRADGQHTLDVRTDTWICRRSSTELPTDAAVPVDCTDCCGCGLQNFRSFALPCETCGGNGIKPDRRLQDAPSLQPVATAA